MSESLLTAIIGAMAALLGSLIGAFGAIAAVERRDSEGKGIAGSCGIIGLATSVMAGIGLIVGLVGATYIVRSLGLSTPPTLVAVQPSPTQIVLVVTATPSQPMTQPTQPPTSAATNTTQPAQITYVPQQVINPPSPLHLKVGESVMPIEGWIWVCTGDFAVTNTSGNRFEYFDNLPNTGLVLVLGADSRMTLSGPSNMPTGLGIGDCIPVSLAQKENAVSVAVSNQLTGGCGSRCSSTRVVELGKDGKVFADYWKP